MKWRAVVVAVTAGLVVAGCGGGADLSDSPSSSTAGQEDASATSAAGGETTTTIAVAEDATQLAQGLQASIPSITQIVTVTEDNDPNDKIGRPNGYTSAAVIYDSNVSCDNLEMECGATIEVWPTAADAQARSDYIQGIKKDAQILGSEYNYLNGPALLRVSGDIKPSVAATYEAAFANS